MVLVKVFPAESVTRTWTLWLVRGLEVEEAAVGDDEVRAREREAAAGVVEKRVGEGVAGIRVGRREGADDGAVGSVLGNRRGRQS